MLRRLPSLPGTGPIAITIPLGWGHGVREGVVVEFQRADGSVWLANFAPGPWGVDNVLAHPNGRDVLVATGGPLWSVNPTTEEATELAPAVVGMWTLANPPRLLFNNQDLNFLCIGSTGVEWTSPRISWDGFRKLRLSDAAMDGEAWSPIDDVWKPFRVNLTDGTVTGGSYRPPVEESGAMPSIPRMPPFNKTVFLIGIGYAVVNAIFTVTVQPPPALEFSILGVLYAAVLLWIVFWRVASAWRVRSFVRQLRRFDAAERTRILREIPSVPAQALLQRLVDEHGGPTTTGAIERFQFSAVDQRQLAFAMWASVGAAIAILVAALTLGLSTGQRIVMAGSAAALSLGAVGFRWLAINRRRVFELSPFAISEIHANGRIRRLNWGGMASLKNRPWLGRIEFYDRRGEHIAIPHSVVGIERLVELTLSHVSEGADHRP